MLPEPHEYPMNGLRRQEFTTALDPRTRVPATTAIVAAGNAVVLTVTELMPHLL